MTASACIRPDSIRPSLRQWALILSSAFALINLCGCSMLPRYAVSDCMDVEVTEYSPCEYPDDPAPHSTQYGRYDGRSLQLIDRGDGCHFDFIFNPHCKNTARIVFRNVDVSIMTPTLPCHVRGDKNWNALRSSTTSGIDNRCISTCQDRTLKYAEAMASKQQTSRGLLVPGTA